MTATAPAPGTPSPRPAPSDGRSNDRRWTLAEKVLGLTTALVGLAVAVLGVTSVQATQAKNEAQDDATGLSTEVGSLQAELDAARRTATTSEAARQRLSDENEELSQKVTSLEGQLPPDVDPGTVGPETPEMRRQGVVDLTEGGDAANIDAPASDPRWGQGGTESYADGAVSLRSDTLSFGRVSMLRLRQGVASYATCSTSTGYAPADAVDPGTMEGKNVCLRTIDGRFATAQIVEQQPGAVRLALTTWETA